MRSGRGWNEENLSEVPAVELLATHGYAFVRPESLEAVRGRPLGEVWL